MDLQKKSDEYQVQLNNKANEIRILQNNLDRTNIEAIQLGAKIQELDALIKELALEEEIEANIKTSKAPEPEVKKK